MPGTPKENLDLNRNIELRRTHIRLLDALKDVCERHKLVYWIDFGTLLGAVRTGDFIPWDDDIDVSMPMRDYQKFLTIAEKELPKDIFLQTPQTDPGYGQYFAKLRDCHSTLLEHHETGDEPYHHGIYIDVFPSVRYPKMPRLLRKILTYATLRTRENVFVLKRRALLNYLLYIICKSIWWLLTPLKAEIFAQTPEDNGYFYVIPGRYLFPLQKIRFHGSEYMAPARPHEYLKILYNDYLKETPVEKRVPHSKLIKTNVPYYRPQARLLTSET